MKYPPKKHTPSSLMQPPPPKMTTLMPNTKPPVQQNNTFLQGAIHGFGSGAGNELVKMAGRAMTNDQQPCLNGWKELEKCIRQETPTDCEDIRIAYEKCMLGTR